jgi:lipopolysaccharide/colanic/teichoic acid biosynthesis glycosyltransferase/glycosyltransferase involved in cell wall biosynthesis
VRVLMLTQWFEPEPAFKGLELARRLVSLGHSVEVLTGFPNYPAGRLYDGYRQRLWQKESVDGVSIVRVPLYPSHDRSIARRALNYLSFAVAAAILGPFLLRRPDVIYVYHPPATIGLPAMVLRHWFSAPVVCDVQDLWPDTIVSCGMLRGGVAMRFLDCLCRYVYRHADRVVVLSPGLRQTLICRGVAADRLDVIYNWAHEVEAKAALPRQDRRDFSVVYTGTMGPAQDLDTVLDAARQCSCTVPGTRFLLVGGGVDAERLQQRAREMMLDNVEFRGWQTPEETQAILRDADALLVHLKDDPLFAITIPSKTQAYLAAGRPIVMAVQGDAADLVARAGAGVLAEPGNAESIANAIRHLVDLPAGERAHMGARGREFYKNELSMARAVERLDTVFCAADSGFTSGLCGKRVLDAMLASTALLLLSPVMAVVALAVRWWLGSPVLFRQLRPGRNEVPFRMLKFRSMHDRSGPDGHLLPDGDRLTGLGRFLRRTSLDELPELWNVLRGEMSLVGPRPLLMEYSRYFTERERLRFRVRPGITGWAQIHGRNHSPWDERLARDVWYVEHQSFLLDLRILATTVGRVLRAESVVSDPRSTMLDLNEERAEC